MYPVSMQAVGLTFEASADAVSGDWSVLGDVIVIGLWLVLGLAVLGRVLWILLRRGRWADKRRDLRSKVGDPLMRSASVQSSLYGWTPSDSRSLSSPPAQTTTSQDESRRPGRDEDSWPTLRDPDAQAPALSRGDDQVS